MGSENAGVRRSGRPDHAKILERLEEQHKRPPVVPTAAPSITDFDERVTRPLERVVKSRNFQQVGKEKPLTAVPMPRADPRKAGFTTPPTASLDLLTKSNESFAASALNLTKGIDAAKPVFDAVPQKLGEATTGLDAASTKFATTFDTGAAKLATAGRTAISDMEAGAGTVGGAIAAAFIARASGLQIGVKLPETIVAGRPDTGAQKVT